MSANDLAALTLYLILIIIGFHFSVILGAILLAILSMGFVVYGLHKIFTYLYKKAGLDD